MNEMVQIIALTGMVAGLNRFFPSDYKDRYATNVVKYIQYSRMLDYNIYSKLISYEIKSFNNRNTLSKMRPVPRFWLSKILIVEWCAQLV